MTDTEVSAVIKSLVMAFTGKQLTDEEIRAVLVEGQKPAHNTAKVETVTLRKCCDCQISCVRRSNSVCLYEYRA